MPAFVKNLLLVLSASLIMLLIAELVVRIAIPLPPDTMDTFNVNKGDYYRADAELGWLPRPDINGIHDRAGSFESTFSTNSLGLRDREHSPLKPDGMSRIVVLGDSFAWGFGVDDGDVFTDVLENRLAGWEVINLGVTAFNLKQEIAYFQRLGAGFDPDILLIAYTQNDLLEGIVATGFQPDRDPASADTRPASSFHGIKAALNEYSALYQATIRAVNGNRRLVALAIAVGLKEPLAGFSALDNNIAPALRNEPAPLQKAWLTLANDLQRAGRIAADNGIRLIVALIPAHQSVVERELERSLAYSQIRVEDLEIDKPYDRVVAMCSDLGIESINPLQHFRELAAAGVPLYLPNDMHFSKDGHAAFAQQIVRYLNRLPPQPVGGVDDELTGKSR